jgi:hypothetical protein
MNAELKWMLQTGVAILGVVSLLRHGHARGWI